MIMFYFVKTPNWLQRIYKNCIWKIKDSSNDIFLTFDDGPHPEVTPFVLDTLKLYGAKATFFCIGKNVESYPEIYQRILNEGHSVGNHTHNHKNGWKTPFIDYIQNIELASKYIASSIFRPPYGRITIRQIFYLKRKMNLQPIMWTILSGDFDKNCSPQQTVENVVKNLSPGSIVVFHDSFKCGEKIKYALPLVLKFVNEKNWTAKRIDNYKQ